MLETIGSMAEMRDSNEYATVRDFILFNKNSFDQTEINPDVVKLVEWDIKVRYSSFLSDQAKERIGEIVRSSQAAKNGHKVGTTALKGLLIEKQPGTTWVKHAGCRDADPDVFFPKKGGSTREAKKICAQCPVSEPCLDYALDNNERVGVWGGYSDRERRQISKLRKQSLES